jgi:hypothetical protein
VSITDTKSGIVGDNGGISPGELVSDSEAAEILHVVRGTLATWRALGRGPAFVKLGRRVFYTRRDLANHIAAQRREPAAA